MSKEMASMGSTIGVAWDDGVHDNVRKIQVSHNHRGINFVKFEYIDGTETVTGDDYCHGKISNFSPKTEEFELESDEYITEVKAHVHCVGPVGEVMFLKFKTNKRTSNAYGEDQLKLFTHTRRKMVFGEKGKKIVGFHGKYAERIYSS